MTVVRRKKPSSTPAEPPRPQEPLRRAGRASFNWEQNLLHAIVNDHGLAEARRRGVGADSFIDLEYCKVFEYVERHFERYG